MVSGFVGVILGVEPAMSSAESSSEPSVVLVSACGFRVSVPRRTAAVSGLLRAMLASSASAEAAAGEVSLPEISKEALLLAVSYMAYKRKHSAGSNGAAIPDFPIPPESALELLVAANFLDL